MRRLPSVCRGAESGSGSFLNAVNIRRAICLAVVGGAVALAQDRAPTDVKSGSRLKAPIATAPAEAAIPACLEQLKLTPPQVAQAKAIAAKYDASLDAVWKQFGEKYMETVRTEVGLLAAIEDTLTEPQRTKVRDQRRRMAHAEKALEGTSSKPNQATAEPADAAEQVIADAGISLTDEQEAVADKIQNKYASRLRSLNRDIQGLHTRVVSLEADKLVELEKVLTKEQLVQLREGRESAAIPPKVTAIEKTSK